MNREKRREPRRRTSGSIRIRFHNPQRVEFEGALVDVSPGGFRTVHDCNTLESGSIVEFWHSTESGQARVMWNRFNTDGIESGFLVIS